MSTTIATTKFKMYDWTDENAPVIPYTGDHTGSLIALLDACLVDGYGTKEPAGWTKPYPNVSGTLGCWKQPSGSQCTWFVNDNSPLSASIKGNEAWMTGWEYLSAMTSSDTENWTGSVGSGYGQFPLPFQQLTRGYVVVKKQRVTGWRLFADEHTCYLFIRQFWQAITNDDYYTSVMFGDIYSYKFTSSDTHKCLLYGRTSNSSSAAAVDFGDKTTKGSTADSPETIAAAFGHFMARSSSGLSRAVGVNRLGDVSKNGYWYNDNGMYGLPSYAGYTYFDVGPMLISEPEGSSIRGRMRGIWCLYRNPFSFDDGQIINGSGNLSGKKFMIVKPGISNVGGATHTAWLVEVSDTVEVSC